MPDVESGSSSPADIVAEWFRTPEDKYNKNTAYGRSKIANIWFTNVLHKKYGGQGIMTYSLHPGTYCACKGRIFCMLFERRTCSHEIPPSILVQYHRGHFAHVPKMRGFYLEKPAHELRIMRNGEKERPVQFSTSNTINTRRRHCHEPDPAHGACAL
jgi:NAD(P)-dependent dehydrogenase (short-subunit alcohol dehydrogenase family)